MRAALRGRGTRHDDLRDQHELPDQQRRGDRRTQPVHMSLRTQPHPFG